jgi:hypothetical protein
MTKAWQTLPRTIRLANGGRLTHEQLITGATEMNKNQVQRPLNSSMHADKIGRDPRRGKNNDAAPIAHGMVRQSKPSHDFLHGSPRPLDDEKEPPIKSYEKPIPVHGGISKASRDKFNSNPANSPSLILADAKNLGRKV